MIGAGNVDWVHPGVVGGSQQALPDDEHDRHDQHDRHHDESKPLWAIVKLEIALSSGNEAAKKLGEGADDYDDDDDDEQNFFLTL